MERQYKLLAFVTLIKKYRENSVIYSYENKKVLAKNLGISYNSYKKYIDICIKEKLIVEYNGNLQCINLVKAISILELRKKLWKYNNFCHSYTYEKLTFKNVYNRIVTCIITLNYEQQAFIIDRNQVLFSKSNSKKKSQHFRSLYKKAIKLNVSTEELLQSTRERKIDKVVSGKYHVAKLTGFSTSSGLRWLRKLHNEKVIERKVEIKLVSTSVTFKDYDFYIDNIEEGRLLPTTKGLLHFQGSSVSSVVDYPVKTKSRRRFKKGLSLTLNKNL